MTPGAPATQGRLAPTKGLSSRAVDKRLPVIKNFPSFALACDNKQIVHHGNVTIFGANGAAVLLGVRATIIPSSSGSKSQA